MVEKNAKNDLTVQFEDFRPFIYLRIDVVSIWIHTWKSDPKILSLAREIVQRKSENDEKNVQHCRNGHIYTVSIDCKLYWCK